ncbi:MAG: hypothetical protein II201_00640, partial [Clostridia bacterium]|nr:hypothetical protein [Clostridia bacterium]
LITKVIKSIGKIAFKFFAYKENGTPDTKIMVKIPRAEKRIENKLEDIKIKTIIKISNSILTLASIL